MRPTARPAPASSAGSPRAASTVDMEAAAFIAVARYRKARFGQVLYAGDSLAGPGRGRSAAGRGPRPSASSCFWLAADACLRLDAGGQTGVTPWRRREKCRSLVR